MNHETNVTLSHTIVQLQWKLINVIKIVMKQACPAIEVRLYF